MWLLNFGCYFKCGRDEEGAEAIGDESRQTGQFWQDGQVETIVLDSWIAK